MTVRNGLGPIAKRFGYALKRTPMHAGTAILAGSMLFCGSAQAEEVDFEDFEGLPLIPFVVAGGGSGSDWTGEIRTGTDREWTKDNSGMMTAAIGDGTDWTNQIRTGTDREWTIDNSGNLSMCEELAFDGFAVLDVNSWFQQQGAGLGRTLFSFENPNNSTLVCDGDAFADFANPALPDNGVNSYICRTYDLSGFDSSFVTITFEYEFASYSDQTGVCEVSFDGGATYETLLELDSAALGDSVLVQDFAMLSTGAANADSMKLRFGYLEADNDWWFAVDNITVTAGGGFSDFENFEGLDLEPFTVAGEGEPAFNGWTAMNVDSWIGNQGVQLGRTSLGAGKANTVLLADGDALDDFVPIDPLGYNSFISRSYDLNGFDVETLQISFDYEFASYDEQRGTVEVSFDAGTTWQLLLDLDSGAIGNSVITAGADGPDVDVVQPAVYRAADGDFDPTSSEMVLRIGYTLADNDWWFAVDNILIETVSDEDCLAGDVNQDGQITLLDVNPFVSVLTSGEFQCEADTNLDGVVSLLDVDPFVQLLTGG